jgi:small-conductance mechanosensitive channel
LALKIVQLICPNGIAGSGSSESGMTRSFSGRTIRWHSCANLFGVRNGIEAFRRILATNPMEVIRPLVVFGVTFAVGWVVRSLILRALGLWVERTQSRPGRIMEQAIRGPMWIWILILAATLAIQSANLPEPVMSYSPTVLLDLWVASLTFMCMRIARDLVRFYGSQIPGAMPVTTLTQNLAQIAVLMLGVLVMLAPYWDRFKPVFATLGIGGLAVALALQDTLSNLFAGFYVAVAGQIRLGDYIKLNTGEEGYVTDIGWRSTIIRAGAHNLIIVPNRTLAQANVTNYNLPEPRLASNLVVNVAPQSDPERVEAVLMDVLRAGVGNVDGLLGEPAPSVHMDPGFGEYSLGFTANYQVADFGRQGPVRHELRKRIWRRFREEGIALAIPARMVVMRQGDSASIET